MAIPQKETPLMALCTDGYDAPVMEVLRQELNAHGKKGGAERLGVSVSTLDYWMKYYGLRLAKVAVPKGYEVVVCPAQSVSGVAPGG